MNFRVFSPLFMAALVVSSLACTSAQIETAPRISSTPAKPSVVPMRADVAPPKPSLVPRKITLDAPKPSLVPLKTSLAAPSFAAGMLPLAAPLPMPPRDTPAQRARVAELQGRIKRGDVFASSDALIAIYKSSGKTDLAAGLEREQSALYRARGKEDAAIIHANRAAALTSQLQVFADVETSAQGAGRLYTGAPLEPVIGCYLGAFIDRDDSLGKPFFGGNWQTHRTPAQFQSKTGKNPGSLFMYLSYGQPFPTRWIAELKAAGTVAHIAWEPKSLAEVRDDAYLRGFARAARAADWPIFFVSPRK